VAVEREPLQVVSPTTGEPLGTVPAASADAVRAAASTAARARPLWSAVPVAARCGFLRRAAQAVLDELEPLAGLLARETGRPRTEALLAELLPSVSGLHALAAAAPAALGDRRLGRRTARAAGRHAALVQAPAGVVGLRGGAASPWAEPLLEAAAALVAGNAVLLVPAARLAGDRIAGVLARAGVPEELIVVLHGVAAAGALGGACDVVAELDPPRAKGTMLVLDGAPLGGVVSGALWAGFAAGGRHPAAVGRIVTGPGLGLPLAEALAAGTQRLRLATRRTRRPRSARCPRMSAWPRSRPRSRTRRPRAPCGCAAARCRSPASRARSTPRRSCATSGPAPRCCATRRPVRCSRSSRPRARRRRSRSPTRPAPCRSGRATASAASASPAACAPS
jgi:hypothetical protein